jgi:tRNA 2-thiouridine synthesizing protein E
VSRTLELADGSRLALDADGCLEDWTGWNREVAERMAAADGVHLGPAHWRVIEVLREYYETYEIAPPMRALVRLLRERGAGEGYGSRELYRLFPQGPAKQACRYAGLPRPVSCI